MEQFFVENKDVIFKLLVAVVLGMLVGAERVFAGKAAGMKTHALVSLGAAVFVVVSEAISTQYIGLTNFDPLRVASQIVVGIGFLGAGSIIFQDNKLLGLTTAGGLWVTAGIGMAAGFGLFNIAFITTVLILLIYIFMNFFEKPLRKISDENLNKENHNA